MDHANAHLIPYTGEHAEAKDVVSKFTHEEKESTLGQSEKLMHNKEQHDESQYYKKIGEMIRSYNDVLLFGPTEAKTELFNLLRADHHFADIRMIVKPSDKLNEHEQQAFIKDYFQKTDIAN